MTRENGPLLAGVADMNDKRWMLAAVIGIGGRMCTGKTTLANNLLRMDDRYRIMSIGDVLRGDIAGLMRVSFVEVLSNKSFYLPMLQLHADMGRTLHGDAYFVDRMLERAVKRGHTRIIVDDVRTVADVEALRKAGMGCHIIHLTAKQAEIERRFRERTGREPTKEEMRHRIEWELEPTMLQGVGLNPDTFVDHHIVTDDQTPADIAQWAANMLHGRGMDFQLEWYNSEEARKEKLWFGPEKSRAMRRNRKPLLANSEIGEAPGA